MNETKLAIGKQKQLSRWHHNGPWKKKKKKARHYGYLALHISLNLFYILKGGGNEAWENNEAFISLANTSDQKVEVMFWCFSIQKAINAEALQ